MSSTEQPGFRTSRGYQMFDQNRGQLSPALEDYLEMIFRQCRKDGYTRVGKISEVLQVRPSSASKMIAKLAQAGYVKYDRYEIIQMTEAGEKLGRYLLSRHEVVTAFLELIGSENVLEQVEIMEHPLTPSTVKNLELLLGFFQADPQAKRQFKAYREGRLK